MSTSPTRRKGKYLPSLPTHQICIVDPTQTPLQCWLMGRNPPQKRNLLLVPLEKRTSQLKPWNWVSVDSNLQSSDPCSLPPDPWESQAGTRSPIPGVSWPDQSRLLSRGPESMLNLLSCWEMEGEWTYWTALHYSEKGTYFRDQVHIRTFFGSLLIFQSPYFLQELLSAYCFDSCKFSLHTNSCYWPMVSDHWFVFNE